MRLSPEKTLFWALVALLVWVPVPLGSNRPWAWSLLEVVVLTLSASWLVLWAFGRTTVSQALRAAWPACLLLGIWLAYSALHFLPLPPSWVAFLSPEAARMQALTDVLGVKRDWLTLSVDPHASRAAFLKSLAYAGIFLLVLALVNNRDRVLTAVRVLVYAAVVHSIYAILMHLADSRIEHFGTVINHGGSASGTFVNRNHFAGHLEMVLALGIGLMIAGLRDSPAGSWKRRVINIIEWVLSPKMILRLALCILVIALTSTHSRMGNTAFFAALLIAGVIGIALSRHAPKSTVVLLASLIAIDLVIVGSWFGVERLAERIEQTTVQEVREREDPAVHTLPMIRDYPVFGAGPGSFYATFPRYRPETIVSFFDAAHNDYVQFAAESGMVGVAILGLFVLLALKAAVGAQRRRHDPAMRGMSFASIMGTTAILIHSGFDFNLQIPANAAYFMVLLALGWISLYQDPHHLRPDPRPA